MSDHENSSGPQIHNVKAMQGNKGAEWALRITGEVEIYTAASKVVITDENDGIVPGTAFFRLEVQAAEGPIKGTFQHFRHDRVVRPGQYSRVVVDSGDRSVSAEIGTVKTIVGD